MRYKVISSKAGYSVQNTKTYQIVNTYQVKEDAVKVCTNLNKPTVNQPMVHVIKVEESNE